MSGAFFSFRVRNLRVLFCCVSCPVSNSSFCALDLFCWCFAPEFHVDPLQVAFVTPPGGTKLVGWTHDGRGVAGLTKIPGDGNLFRLDLFLHLRSPVNQPNPAERDADIEMYVDWLERQVLPVSHTLGAVVAAIADLVSVVFRRPLSKTIPRGRLWRWWSAATSTLPA